jgi:acyl-homoserine-lactone acylase
MRGVWALFGAVLAQITIYRDSFGTPYIFGKTDAEVAYGLAWAHAEDDFARLQYAIALAKGKLGRLIGKEGAAMDYFAHFTGAFHLAKAQYDSLPSDIRRVIEAYVAGLNDYARQHPKEVLDKKLFPFTPQELIQGYITILSGMIGVGQALQATLAGHPSEYRFSVQAGSNAIALHRQHTEENETFLLINPHVPIEGALRWYEAYLHSEEGWEVLGGFFPGSIAPGLGTTPHHGWAVTFNWPDFVDIYQLKMHPQNPRLYSVDNAWETLRVEKVRLQVRLGKPRSRLVQGWPVQGLSKVRGPFLTVSKRLEWSLLGPIVRTPNGVYALRFPAEKLFRAPEQWYRLSKARTFSEFYQAMHLQGIPHFNFVYAAPDTIFYLFNATLPERPAGWNWQGVLPGDTRQTLWRRYLTIEELPQVLNPPCGYVFSVNNSPFLVTCPEASPKEADFPPGHGWEWNRHNNRELRLRELMEGKERFSWADFVRIKYDRQYPRQGAAAQIWQSFASLPDTSEPFLMEALRVVRQWDLSGEGESPQAALCALAVQWAMRQYKLPGYSWLETAQTQIPIEGRWKALAWASTQLKKHYGRLDPPWKAVQAIEVQGRRYPLGGLPEQLAPAYGTWDEKKGFLRVEAGDTYIQMVRFRPRLPDGTRPLPIVETILPLGVSGRPDSPHYADQVVLFHQGQRKAMTLHPAEIEKKKVHVYTLTPGSWSGWAYGEGK